MESREPLPPQGLRLLIVRASPTRNQNPRWQLSQVCCRHIINAHQFSRFMKAVPGTLQEGGASFQTTHWTVVLQAGQGRGPESSQQAIAEFCESYWPPLYAF